IARVSPRIHLADVSMKGAQLTVGIFRIVEIIHRRSADRLGAVRSATEDALLDVRSKVSVLPEIDSKAQLGGKCAEFVVLLGSASFDLGRDGLNPRVELLHVLFELAEHEVRAERVRGIGQDISNEQRGELLAWIPLAGLALAVLFDHTLVVFR